MNNIAFLDNIVIIDEYNPIGYTYNLLTCFALLIKRFHSEVLIHVFADKTSYDMNHFLNALNLKDDEIMSVEIFKGPQTSINVIDSVIKELNRRNYNYQIKDAFLSLYGTCGSVGYNHNDKCYYKTNDYYELEEVKEKTL